jgi:xylan 1,4-beta-xylosidase
MNLEFLHVPADAGVSIQRIDADHGNVLKEYAAMGKPLDPTAEQVKKLNKESSLPAPEQTKLRDGKLELKLTPNAMALIVVQSR